MNAMHCCNNAICVQPEQRTGTPGVITGTARRMRKELHTMCVLLFYLIAIRAFYMDFVALFEAFWFCVLWPICLVCHKSFWGVHSFHTIRGNEAAPAGYYYYVMEMTNEVEWINQLGFGFE